MPGRSQIANALANPPRYGSSSGQWRVSTVTIVLSSIHSMPSGVYTSSVKWVGEEAVTVEPSGRHQDEDAKCRVAEGESLRPVFGEHPGEEVETVEVAVVDIAAARPPTACCW